MNQETTGTGGGGAAGGIPVERRGRVLPGEDGQDPGEGEENEEKYPVEKAYGSKEKYTELKG